MSGRLSKFIFCMLVVTVAMLSNVPYSNAEQSREDSLTTLKEAMDDYGVKKYTILERNGLKIEF